MELDWKHLLKVYAPFVVLVVFNVLAALYTVGFEAGKRALLDASLHANYEAKHRHGMHTETVDAG